MPTSLLFGPDGSPLGLPTDVIKFLAEEKHWKVGRSAYEAANSWCKAQDLPPVIRELLETDQVFAGARLTKAIFEKQTQLDNLGRPSQTDVLAFLKTNSGTAVVGVEAKVDETFGPIVSEWNDHTPGKSKRLEGLLKRLELIGDVSGLRYQLIHRTAAALIEAETYGAKDAAMVVQSFSPSEIRSGFSDFQRFTEMMGAPVKEPGRLSMVLNRNGIRLRLGWAQDVLHSG